METSVVFTASSNEKQDGVVGCEVTFLSSIIFCFFFFSFWVSASYCTNNGQCNCFFLFFLAPLKG